MTCSQINMHLDFFYLYFTLNWTITCLFWLVLQTNAEVPSETECRLHIEKALNTLKEDNKGNEIVIYRDYSHELIEIILFEILEPDSAEVVVEVDDSNEKDVADVDDDDSDEAKSDDINDNADDDSTEGIQFS